jgi:hypothetical protein
MPEMASSTLLSCTHLVYTPFKKRIKSLIMVFFKMTPVMPNEALELGEKLFNWVEVRRIRR